MSEQFRALAVVLVLSSAAFYFSQKFVKAAGIMAEADFIRRRNYWYLVTLVGFLSPNYWVFAIVVSAILLRAARQDNNKIALFFFLILALPQTKVEVPGIFGINYFVELDYLRILILIVLGPYFLHLRRQSKKNNGGYCLQDILLILYISLCIMLRLRYDSATGVLRYIFYWLVDVVIPYYVVSRGVKNIKDLKEVVNGIVVAVLVVSVIGVFEYLKHWLLYSAIGAHYGSRDVTGGYLLRGDLLRAVATSGQPIILGYVVAIGIGFYFFIQDGIKDWKLRSIGFLILIAGIIAPVSRGPWVGLMVIMLVLFALSKQKSRIAVKMALFAPPVLMLIAITDIGSKVIDYLPFVGTVEEGNVEYRKSLFNTSIDIILSNPFFGSVDYLLNMEHLRTGLGIIDLVNNYLIVALNFGFVGLFLFLSFFVSGLYKLLRTAYASRSVDGHTYKLGQSIIAVLIGILAIIATTSPIYHVPIFYWTIGAMCVSYVNLINSKNEL